MKIVTVASDDKRYFPYLVESCKRHQCPLIVLGWGVPWKGFSLKIQLMQKFLDTQLDEDIICFVDAYDVVILQHHDVIVRKFKRIVGNRKDLVLVSEDRSSNESMMFRIFNWLFFLKCKGTYLNSGTYMGYVGTLKKVINSITEISQDVAEDDQRMMQTVCTSNPSMFIIDRSCDVFLVSCYPGKPIPRAQTGIQIVDYTIKFNDNIYPCILHASGYTDIDDVLQELGYKEKLYTFNKEECNRYITKSIQHFLWWFIMYNAVGLILMLLLLIGFALYLWVRK